MRIRVTLAFSCLCVAVFSWPSDAIADDVDNYLEATLSSIRTLSFDYSVSSSDLRLENEKGKLWAVLDSGRITRLKSKYEWPLGPGELIVNDGKLIRYDGKTRTYTVNSELETPAAGSGNPLVYALWVTRIKDKPFMGSVLTSLRNQPFIKVTNAPKTQYPDAVFYSTQYDNSTEILGFSPAHNYLPCFLKLTPKGNDSWVENRVETFSEIAKGVYFPTLINRKSFYVQTKKENLTKIVFTNVRINDSIPDSAFAIKYTEGDKVVDAIVKRVYIANINGMLQDNKKMQLFDYGSRRDGTTGELITTSTKAWNYYLWSIVGGILAVALVVLIWYAVYHWRTKGVENA